MSTDEELISQYLEGDQNAIEGLVKNYLKPVFNFVFRLVGDAKAAEDLTQETFIKAWKNLKKFDKQKKFKPWLFKIARNTAVDYLRKKKEINFSDLAVIDENGVNIGFDPADDVMSLLSQMEQAEQIKKLEAGLVQLSESERSLLLLYFVEKITFREIAEIMDMPADTVKSRYRRALIKIRKSMADGNSV